MTRKVLNGLTVSGLATADNVTVNSLLLATFAEVFTAGVRYGALASAMFSLNTGSASNEGIVVRGVASQTADMQQWQSNTPTTLARVTAAGLGDFSTAGLRTKHEGASTPTGGSSGEVRVGNGKIWVNDAGTWKSVAVA